MAVEDDEAGAATPDQANARHERRRVENNMVATEENTNE